MSKVTNAVPFLGRLRGKQPPAIPRSRSLLTIHAHDKKFTF